MIRPNVKAVSAAGRGLGITPRVTEYSLTDAPRALDDLARGAVAGAGVLVMEN